MPKRAESAADVYRALCRCAVGALPTSAHETAHAVTRVLTRMETGAPPLCSDHERQHIATFEGHLLAMGLGERELRVRAARWLAARTGALLG